MITAPATAAVRERPILFKGPMVRAILLDRKTQTRRVVLPQPVTTSCQQPPTADVVALAEAATRLLLSRVSRCPYGRPGDHLWVRETWAVRRDLDHVKPRDLDPVRCRPPYYLADGERPSGCAGGMGKTRQSIFLPRWGSRITLELTDVRTQRLQEVSEADAMAEGFHKLKASGRVTLAPGAQYLVAWPTARAAFQETWDEIQLARSYEDIGRTAAWASNPWVWALTFRRIT